MAAQHGTAWLLCCIRLSIVDDIILQVWPFPSDVNWQRKRVSRMGVLF